MIHEWFKLSWQLFLLYVLPMIGAILIGLLFGVLLAPVTHFFERLGRKHAQQIYGRSRP